MKTVAVRKRCVQDVCLLLTVALLLSAFLTPSCVKDDPVDPFGDIQLDPEEYVADSDPNKIVNVDGDEFPVNELVFTLVEGAGPDVAAEVALSVGGELVGQLEVIGFYQARVPSETVAELDALVAAVEARAEVEEVTYNVLVGVTADDDLCHEDDDNHALQGNQRCAFADVGYYQAVPIMDEVAKHITPQKVRIGIIDTGLEEATGQFTGVDVYDIRGDDLTDTDEVDGHGTDVAGIIAADNNGKNTNGLASRLLKNRLELVVDTWRVDHTVNSSNATLAKVMFELTRLAGRASATVVNISRGSKINYAPTARSINGMFGRAFRAFPRSLFVIGAGNDGVELKPESHIPVAGHLPNTITVGGTVHCNPSALVEFSNHGSYVDIYAPAENVPCLELNDPEGGAKFCNGTSFATPIVSSLAAVLFAVDPLLTPDEIRQRILETAKPHGEPDSFVMVVSYPDAILETVMKLTQSPPAALLEILDVDEDADYDHVGQVIARICNQTLITIENVGTYTFANTSDDSGQQGMMDPSSITLTFADDEIQHASLTIRIMDSFELANEYTVPDPATIGFSLTEGVLGCNATSGQVTIDNCAIVERLDLVGLMTTVEMEGTALVGMHCTDVDQNTGEFVEFSAQATGFFLQPVVAFPDEAMQEYLEIMCVGGTQYVP